MKRVARDGDRCYLLSGGGVLKRIVDWAEKISAGSMLIGIFQDRPSAVLFGLIIILPALRLERSGK